jgi:hypothetical protein
MTNQIGPWTRHRRAERPIRLDPGPATGGLSVQSDWSVRGALEEDEAVVHDGDVVAGLVRCRIRLRHHV